MITAEVMLQLRNNREMLDDLLVSMLVRCKHLTRLQYDGIIRSLDTLRDICQLQAENKTRKNSNTCSHSIQSISTLKIFFLYLKKKLGTIEITQFLIQIVLKTKKKKTKNKNKKKINFSLENTSMFKIMK